MTYEERVQEYWKAIEGKGIDGTTIAVGLGLIELWRRHGLQAVCTISTKEVAELLGMTDRNVQKARQRLVGADVGIWLSAGKHRQPQYCFRAEDVPKNWHTKETPKKEKPKVKVTMVAEQNLFDQNRKTRADMNKVDKENENIHKHKDKPFERPTLEECVAEFLKQGSTEEEARLFFSYFDRLDWYTSNGKAKIKRLDSAVNYWLQTSKRYERTTNNRQCGKLASQEDALRAELLTRYGQI